MGLDMTWFAKPTKRERMEAVITQEGPYNKEIGYFRKFHDLNDFMLTEASKRGLLIGDGKRKGIPMDLDFVNVMEAFATDANYRNFGEGEGVDRTRYKLLMIVSALRYHLKEGREVYYTCLW